MKTKLLRKIRKRYSITRIDEIASNAGEVYKEYKRIFGVPFYVFHDKEDEFGIWTKLFTNIEDAMEYLWRNIIADYGEKFRHRDKTYQKVWWNPSSNKK